MVDLDVCSVVDWMVAPVVVEGVKSVYSDDHLAGVFSLGRPYFCEHCVSDGAMIGKG